MVFLPRRPPRICILCFSSPVTELSILLFLLSNSLFLSLYFLLKSPETLPLAPFGSFSSLSMYIYLPLSVSSFFFSVFLKLFSLSISFCWSSPKGAPYSFFPPELPETESLLYLLLFSSFHQTSLIFPSLSSSSFLHLTPSSTN